MEAKRLVRRQGGDHAPLEVGQILSAYLKYDILAP